MKQKIKIKLSNKFYDKDAIKEALSDFAGVCQGRILNDSIEVELEPKEPVENLEGEFCNYVLGLTKDKLI
tara:strand:- start:2868 stop:3077 length:210 start_codon:yes stop_codon:yes gene_type:complete